MSSDAVDLVRVTLVALIAGWVSAMIVLLSGTQAEPLPPLRVDPGDGRVMTPRDLNGDGFIIGDVEEGS